MTDFLTNLAARAIREEQELHPRLASRFEPPPQAMDLSGLPEFLREIEADQAAEPPEPGAPGDRRRSHPDLEWDGQFPVDQPQGFISRTPKPPAEEWAHAARDPAGEGRTELENSSQPMPQPPIFHPAPGEGALDLERPGRRNAGEQAAEAGIPRAAPALAPQEQSQPIPSVDRQEPLREDIRERAGKQVAARRFEPEVRIERSAPQDDKRAVSDQPDSAPDVHISIGRIEVRAVNGPQPPRAAAAPAGPRVTLEEYLKSRSGGGS